MDVTLGQLRALHELARRGTVAAAAEALGYTTGAVSQQLATLEKATGRELTTKAGRRLQLTRSGVLLAEHAAHVLQAQRDLERALRADDEDVAGPVRIGTFATTASALLAPALAEAAQRYPKMTITSREFGVDETASAVSDGEVDIALGIDYSHAPMPRGPRIELVRLHTERFGLGVAADLRHSGATSLATTRNSPWILPPARTQYARALYAACRLSGFEPQVVHEVTDTRTSLELAARGLGVAPVTDLMAELLGPEGLRKIELRERVERHIVLVRPKQPQSAAVTAVTDLFSEIVRRARDGTDVHEDGSRPGTD